MLIYLSAPTSGGQYHWVSEFAPRSSQNFVSYIVGKMLQLLSQTWANRTRVDLGFGMADRSCFGMFLIKFSENSC